MIQLGDLVVREKSENWSHGEAVYRVLKMEGCVVALDGETGRLGNDYPWDSYGFRVATDEEIAEKPLVEGEHVVGEGRQPSHHTGLHKCTGFGCSGGPCCRHATREEWLATTGAEHQESEHQESDRASLCEKYTVVLQRLEALEVARSNMIVASVRTHKKLTNRYSDLNVRAREDRKRLIALEEERERTQGYYSGLCDRAREDRKHLTDLKRQVETPGLSPTMPPVMKNSENIETLRSAQEELNSHLSAHEMRVQELERKAAKAMAAIEAERKPVLMRDRVTGAGPYIKIGDTVGGWSLYYRGALTKVGKEGTCQKAVVLWPCTLEPIPSRRIAPWIICLVLIAIGAALLILAVV